MPDLTSMFGNEKMNLQSEYEITENMYVHTEAMRFVDPRESEPEVFELHFRKNI